MLPESRDKRISYDVKMPQPPQPRRRGTMEFYEWIGLVLFLASLGMSASAHMVLTAGAEGFAVKEDANGILFPDLGVVFFFFLLVAFDYAARMRYTRYSSQLLDQWQEDKIRLMKMYSESMEKKAKRSEEDDSEK